MMNIKEAKEFCIKSHKGQYRRPSILSHSEVKCMLDKHDVKWIYGDLDYTFEDGSNVIWEDLNEEYQYRLPYHTHPFEVADMLTNEEDKIVAYLHDILEDTDLTYKDIEAKFGVTIAYKIDLLTHKKGVTYINYIKNVIKSKSTIRVKIADITCNLLDNPSANQIKKYRSGMKILLKGINNE